MATYFRLAVDRLTTSSSVTLLPYTSVPLTKIGPTGAPSGGPQSSPATTVEEKAEAVTEGEITKRIDDIGRWGFDFDRATLTVTSMRCPLVIELFLFGTSCL